MSNSNHIYVSPFRSIYIAARKLFSYLLPLGPKFGPPHTHPYPGAILNVKYDSVIGLPMYDFLLMFNSNIEPNSAPLRDIRLQNFGDLDFDLSRSLKVKCEGTIGHPIHGFLLMCNSNIGPDWAPLWDINLQNLGDLEFDLSRSLKVESQWRSWTPHMWLPVSV